MISSLVLAEANLYFIEPKDNQELTGPVTVIFGLKEFGVAPAGYDIERTGHHHLLINVDFPIDFTKPIPADANHLHFGKGQTETVLNLERGVYKLRLLLGNYVHIPHSSPIYSDEITIIVN